MRHDPRLARLVGPGQRVLAHVRLRRLRARRRDHLTLQLAIGAIALALAAIPGRALVAWVTGS